jgi:hypothetical protein
MSSLFNTPEGAEVIGVNSDREFGLEKAKKGTPEYEKWLEQYRAKRGKKAPEGEAQQRQKALDILGSKAPKNNEEKQEKKYTSRQAFKDITNALDIKQAAEEAYSKIGDPEEQKNPKSFSGEPVEKKINIGGADFNFEFKGISQDGETAGVQVSISREGKHVGGGFLPKNYIDEAKDKSDFGSRAPKGGYLMGGADVWAKEIADSIRKNPVSKE